MSYNVTLTDVRTSVTKEGTRYAKVRAIANGVDSYNSVFTMRARESLINQMKSNGVKTNALHRNSIIGNIQKYLNSKLETALPNEKEDITEMLGLLPAMDFPIGTVEDAYFVDDNVVEAVIKENTSLRGMGEEREAYLNSAWDMVMNGTLSGVSLVFNDLKTSQVGDKLFIDDLQVQGLDFVDRPAHRDTRVIDTFMRAMQDMETNKMTNETETKPTETKPVEQPKQEAKVVEVDEIVNKVTEKLTEQQKEEKRMEQLSQSERELEELRKYKEMSEAEKQRLAEEKDEATKIAEEALKAAESATAKIDNPFAQRAKEESEASKALEGKSLRELVKLRFEAS
jgi:hypothetical protein